MTRPNRNRLVIALFWLGSLALANALPGNARIAFVVIVIAATAISYSVAADFFAGKRYLRKKQWVEALTAFRTFEDKLTASPGRQKLAWLAWGVYSLDPIAVARNGTGVVHLENGKLELAEAAFFSALARDGSYAVPHVNLAVVAARRKDAAVMEQQLAEAARLGVTSAKVAKKVRAALGA